MAEKQKSSKKDKKRKTGQNSAYKAEHRHEKSHCKHIIEHIKRYGFARDAADALMRYATNAGGPTFVKARSFIGNLNPGYNWDGVLAVPKAVKGKGA